MESDLQHQKQLNPGLTRYQSAPSSYFASILDSESLEEFLNRPSSPETERIFARFLSSSGVTSGNNNENASIQNLETINEREIEIKSEPQNQITGQMNDGSGYLHQQQQQQQQQNQTNFSSASPGFYQSQRWPENPNPGSNMDYATPGTMGSDRLPPMRTAGSRNSNLIRHQSSPAGLFANIDIERIGEMKGFGDYTANIVRSDPEEAFPAASRPFSSSGLMTPNADIMDKNMGLDSSGNAAAFGNSIRDDYSAGFQVGSWDASSLRRLADEDRTLSGPNEYEIQQKPDAGNRPPLLAHHLSLPKGSAEMSAFEKLLQYQDSVPCKMRAKRGFATHPRSIAERVRRTKISERMRKLQDLVPNMDKQTSTADMLDLAVDYIKDLQEQVKVLSDSREKCSCSDQDQDQDQDRQQQ